jgi:hypothetical protein
MPPVSEPWRRVGSASRGVNDPVAARAGWPRACPVGSFTPRLACQLRGGMHVVSRHVRAASDEALHVIVTAM